jgi:hypothetical protein
MKPDWARESWPQERVVYTESEEAVQANKPPWTGR